MRIRGVVCPDRGGYPRPLGATARAEQEHDMKRSLLHISFAMTVLLLGSSVAVHSQKSRRVTKEKIRVPASEVTKETAPIFKGIERAWRSGDAGALSGFVGEQRVYLRVRGLGEEGGHFSKPQLYYLFKRMFKTTKLKRFEFVKFHNSGSKARKVYGTAYRSFENTSSGRLFQDKVYVTLKLEGERWVVSEIKSTW
jgi:hypothetical protein